jgi:hypothetical protein
MSLEVRNNQILADPSSSTTTATMPSIDAKITATYRAVTSADKNRYYPRARYGDRMVGGVFEGTNTNGNPVIGTYTTIYTVTNNPPTAWSEVSASLGSYRYLRYRSPLREAPST